MVMLKDVEKKIIFVEYPTVLVTLDGEPKFAAGFEKVLNTLFLIFRISGNPVLHNATSVVFMPKL